jgi:hypothetical protein
MRLSIERALIVGVTALLLGGCADDGVVAPNPDVKIDPSTIASCESCHTNYAALMQLAAQDTTPPAGGCGGEAPRIEPYDRVFMGGDGFGEFKSSVHGRIECVSCHGGVDRTSDKQAAHSGSFVKSPSTRSEACGHCHYEMVPFHNSLHRQGWGQKNSQIERAGVTAFHELPQGIQTGYQQNCSTCHASTCGDCHVTRPKAGGGGLLNGHAFRAPDMRDNCTACHSSRGGHAYFGVGAGTQPDVHLTKAGFTCTTCHDRDELHGDRRIYEHRYQVRNLPTCTECHGEIGDRNEYHTAHLNDLSCHTCHSQNYNNCGSCHVGGEGARVGAHQSYKIAVNPLQDVRPYRLALVRRTPAAPDSWSNYGVPTLANFDARPTFNYTTPHNILRWTSRTRVEQSESCYAGCHIIKDGESYRNRHLYLFQSDLVEPWERSANRDIVVDGKLPSAWGSH